MAEGEQVSDDTREEREEHHQIPHEPGLVHSVREFLKPLWFGQQQKIDKREFEENAPMEEKVEDKKRELEEAQREAGVDQS